MTRVELVRAIEGFGCVLIRHGGGVHSSEDGAIGSLTEAGRGSGTWIAGEGGMVWFGKAEVMGRL